LEDDQELMLLENPPAAESTDLVVFDLFEDDVEAKFCYVSNVPVFFAVHFTAETRISLVGFELFSRSSAPNKCGDKR
jgi:hypothetical protein